MPDNMSKAGAALSDAVGRLCPGQPRETSSLLEHNHCGSQVPERQGSWQMSASLPGRQQTPVNPTSTLSLPAGHPSGGTSKTSKAGSDGNALLGPCFEREAEKRPFPLLPGTLCFRCPHVYIQSKGVWATMAGTSSILFALERRSLFPMHSAGKGRLWQEKCSPVRL